MTSNREPARVATGRGLGKYVIGNNSAGDIAEIEQRVEHLADLRFRRSVEQLAVTEILDLGLPTRESKRKTRADKKWPYEAACELDAIPPDHLRALVQTAIGRHLPPEQFAAAQGPEGSERVLIGRLVGMDRGRSMTPHSPSQVELRRGEAATWGSRPDADAPSPAIVASNLRMSAKGTLIAIADITVPKSGKFTVRRCMLCRKGDQEWFAFPSREWVDRSGQRQFANLIQFGDRPIGDRFKAAALTAMRELLSWSAP